MKAVFNVLLSALLLTAAAGCSGDEPSPRFTADGAVVEEDVMPGTMDERTYAATEDPDRGEHARAQMERTDEAIRQGGEKVGDLMGERHMAYTRPVLQEGVLRDGFTGAVIR